MTDRDCIEILKQIYDEYNLQKAIPSEYSTWYATCSDALEAAIDKIQGREKVERYTWLREHKLELAADPTDIQIEPSRTIENVFEKKDGGTITVVITETYGRKKKNKWFGMRQK